MYVLEWRQAPDIIIWLFIQSNDTFHRAADYIFMVTDA